MLHSTPLVTIINCWYKHINENIRPFSVMTKWFDFLILWISDWVSEWASVHVNMQIKCVFNFDDRNDFKSVTEIRNLSFCIEFFFLQILSFVWTSWKIGYFSLLKMCLCLNKRATHLSRFFFVYLFVVVCLAYCCVVLLSLDILWITSFIVWLWYFDFC